jgi:hypothetical protein
MNDNQTLLIVVGILSTATLLMVGACLFFIGYFIGRQSSVGVSNSVTKTNRVNNNSTIIKDKISIDETKVVTEINTDGLEKKYETLGETKQSNENITNSINKLKNMKR